MGRRASSQFRQPTLYSSRSRSSASSLLAQSTENACLHLALSLNKNKLLPTITLSAHDGKYTLHPLPLLIAVIDTVSPQIIKECQDTSASIAQGYPSLGHSAGHLSLSAFLSLPKSADWRRLRLPNAPSRRSLVEKRAFLWEKVQPGSATARVPRFQVVDDV